jgi:ribosomal protein S20
MVCAATAVESVAHDPRKTTMSKLRSAGMAGLLVVAALVGGTVIGSVAAGPVPRALEPAPDVAAPSAATPAAGTKAAAFCAEFRRAFAANLGVAESELAPAAKAAAIATIDAAVADGTLTVAAGDRLKARIEAADADGCALLAGRIGAGKVGTRPAAGAVRDGLIAAAKALGITPAELGGTLREGGTLKEVATAKSVPYATVTAAIVAAVKADLDRAVAAGTLRQARADRILDRLERSLADGRLRPAPGTRAAPASPAPANGS